MAAALRISRGFHRLGLFLAAIALLLGGAISAYLAYDTASHERDWHGKLVCAHEHGTPGESWTIPSDAYSGYFEDLLPIEERGISLKKLGCSDSEYDTPKFLDARDVSPDFNWLSVVVPPLGLGLAITLAVSFAIYGLVRAIGWVIGGFAAS